MTSPTLGPAAPSALHVMSFNVRRRLDAGWRRADRWEVRRPLLARFLAAERPALLGAQEVLPDMAGAIASALGPSYRYVGRGRGVGGRGEACPIFFDGDRLELREGDQFALSESPGVAGSRSWGSVFPRAAVRAGFRDRATNLRLTVLNTHLDAFSPWARREAAALLRRELLAAEHPVIVTADLNTPVASAAARTLLSAGLREAWEVADERLTPAWGTFANYRPPRAGGARIDLLAVSDDVHVERAAIAGAAIDGGWPSDHLAVHAHVRLPGSENP